MNKYDFKSGDMVQHIQLKDAVGILIDRDLHVLYSDVLESWRVFWICHPDEPAIPYIYSKWIKPFRGYRKRRQKVDKSDSK